MYAVLISAAPANLFLVLAVALALTFFSIFAIASLAENESEHRCRMASVDEHFEIGGLLLEALAVNADIKKRIAANPNSTFLRRQQTEIQATVAHLTDAYMESMERFRNAPPALGHRRLTRFLKQGRQGYEARGEDSHFARELTMAEDKTKPTVLVVDDEPRILDSIKTLLDEDFEVKSETDGARALGLLDNGPVAVIVADQRMPGLSGDEFLAKAREISDATRILLTGYVDIDALIRAVNDGGIHKYMSKPWEPVQLKDTVFQGAERFWHLQQQRHMAASL
jgi:CheY-like chemotaxis protein